MTAIGERTAIVGLGVSCQTAHQIRSHTPTIGALLGEHMKVRRSPFDWMLSSIDATCAMVRNDDYFPHDMAELQWCTHPYWARYDCFFWHEDRSFDHPGDFYKRLAPRIETIERLASMERRIFIVSNTQNALPGIITEAGGFDPRITDERLDRLQAVLDERFGPSELYAVTYLESGGAAASDRVFHIRRDRSQWKGARSLWTEVFRAICLGHGAVATGD